MFIGRHFKIFCLGAAFLVSQAHQEPAIQRYGLTPGDKFRICSAGILGKPILTDLNLRNTILDCPVAKDEMLRRLDKKGIYNFELDDLYYWVPASRFTASSPSGQQVQWEELTEEIKFKNWGTIPGSRMLSEKERESIGKSILNQTRLAPIPMPYQAGKDGKTAELQYTFFMDAHHLSPHAPESVIVVSGLENGWARLIYGEMEKGAYHVVWESPLFSSVELKIGYTDVDADGTAEILIATTSGPRLENRVLSIFDKNGHELTRQLDDCEMIHLLQPNEATCPIVGTSIELVNGRNGRKNILSRGSQEQGTADVTYQLQKGTYIPEGNQKTN